MIESIRTGRSTGVTVAPIYRIRWLKKHSRSLIRAKYTPVLAGSPVILLWLRVQNIISQGFLFISARNILK